MSTTKPTQDALENRLRELESLVEGIRSGEVDSVVADRDHGGVLVLREYELEKQRERQLAQLKAIIDTVPAALAIVRPEGKIHLANQAFHQASRAEDSRSLRDWVEGVETETPLSDAVTNCLSGCLDSPQRPVVLKAVFRNRAEDRVCWVMTFQRLPITIDDGPAVVVCGADVTAEDRLISELCEAKSQTEHFLAAAAHDLKSPLFTITHNLAFARESLGPGLPAEADDYLRRAECALRDMQMLLTRLTDVCSAGYSPEPRRLLCIRTLAESAIRQLEGLLTARGAEVVIANDLPELYCQEHGIVQVFSNLISNAVKYTPSDRIPRIQVGWEWRADLGHVFFVRDNGEGIAKEHLPRVFEPFRRLCTDPAVAGQGLGLNIVERAVGAHGGQVWAEATPGEGSTFYFSVPQRKEDRHGHGNADGELPPR